MTVAPYASSCAILASGADAGTKITHGWAIDAEMPARAAAALPVLAVATICAFCSRALTTAIELARSFRDAVGWRPSSLTQTRRTPRAPARRGASYMGVPPTVSGGSSASSVIGSSGR